MGFSTGEMTRTNRIRRYTSIVTIVVALVAWYLLTTQFHLIPSLFFPSPKDVIDNLVMVRSSIVEHTAYTLGRVLLSYVAGCALGVGIGLLMSRFKAVFGLLEPPIEALRPIPPVALIPFFILWFGIGNFGKILLTGLGCFMVMCITTLEAVRNVPKIYIHAAQSLGATEDHCYRTVVMPAIVPELIPGLRVALAGAFGLMIASELMGAQQGLGFLIMVARRSLNTQTILLGIIIIGLVAFSTDRLLGYLTSRATGWTERVERS